MLHLACASCHSSSPSSSPSRFSSERYGSLVDPGSAPLAGSGGDTMPNPAMHVNDFHWRSAAFSLGSVNSATVGSRVRASLQGASAPPRNTSMRPAPGQQAMMNLATLLQQD